MIRRMVDTLAGVLLRASRRPGAQRAGEAFLYYDSITRKLRLATEDGDAAVGGTGGGGTGDVTGPSASVDSEIAVYSGTTGKVIKRATTTGLLKATSGVISAASAGTDYYAPGGTDIPIADGGTGQSTKAAAFDALAPTTTNEDIIVRRAGTNTRIAAPASADRAGSTLGFNSSGEVAWVVLGVISAIRIGTTPSTGTPLTGGDDYYDVGDEMTAFIDATVP